MRERIVSTAISLMEGKVTKPCVSIDERRGQVKMCPLLDLKEGCTSTIGITVGEGEIAACGEGKGNLVIQSESLESVLSGKEVIIS